jgi:hypothetical protein
MSPYNIPEISNEEKSGSKAKKKLVKIKYTHKK